MAFALDALGKQVRIVNADAAPDHYPKFPASIASRSLPLFRRTPTPTR